MYHTRYDSETDITVQRNTKPPRSVCSKRCEVQAKVLQGHLQKHCRRSAVDPVHW